jgi:lysophospholipase L1-like esterase
MKMQRFFPAFLSLFWLAAPAASGQANQSDAVVARGFRFEPNDMVVMLGGTFFERDYEYGHLEAAISEAFPGLGLRFRNLGWSADTVWGTSRSYFGPPSEGLERLRAQLREIKPSVILCQFGAAEAWDGSAKLDAFIEGYRKLLDLLAAAAGPLRIVLISPLPAENLRPFPNLDAHNAHLRGYRDAVRRLSDERSLPFVDAMQLAASLPADAAPLTTNGLHFSEKGYRRLAALIPPVVGGSADGRPVDEKLRALIIEKNRLFFHRWRPANETYLFGFRKHEQGRNAAEIPLFDPLIEAKEKEIAARLATSSRRQP